MSKCLNCPESGKHPFCNLTGDARDFFESNSVGVRYPQGGILFREGEKSDAVFVLCSGRVKISTVSRHGRTMILRIAQTGDVLGLSAALGAVTHEATAESIQPSTLRVVKSRIFADMLERFPEVGMATAKAVSQDYRAAFEEARRIALGGTPAGRLANLLLDWTSKGKDSSTGKTINMPLTHEELASMTGTSRETVTRTLGRLRKDKIIETHGVALTVLQPSALNRLSAC